MNKKLFLMIIFESFFSHFIFLPIALPTKSACCLQAMLACLGTLPYPGAIKGINERGT